MKPISCKEAALALGVTARTIQNKLKNGDLKGLKQTNKYGTEEWRVWPTKEITEGLKKLSGTPAESLDFAPDSTETIDAEEVSLDDVEETLEAPESWRETERQRIEMLAEVLIKPLTERLEAQGVALREQERVIEDQQRQLRLLPDLQKQAEEEHQTAEMKALENEALKKQIAALDEERLEKEAKLEQMQALETQVTTLRQQVEDLQKPWWKKLF